MSADAPDPAGRPGRSGRRLRLVLALAVMAAVTFVADGRVRRRQAARYYNRLAPPAMRLIDGARDTPAARLPETAARLEAFADAFEAEPAPWRLAPAVRAEAAEFLLRLRALAAVLRSGGREGGAPAAALREALLALGLQQRRLAMAARAEGARFLEDGGPPE